MNFALAAKCRALDGLRAYFLRVKYEDLTSLEEMRPFIRLHMAMVYYIVIVVLSNWRLGTLFFDSPNLLIIPGLVGFGRYACSLCLTPPEIETKRFFLLIVAAFLLGFCTGPLVAHQCFIVTSIETVLMLLGMLIWGAVWTGHRAALYLSVMILAVLIFSWSSDSASTSPDGCYGNPWAFKRWFASFCAMLYVVAYTQVMVARASALRGDIYFVQQDVHFFTDLPSVIYRFGSILLMQLMRAFQK